MKTSPVRTLSAVCLAAGLIVGAACSTAWLSTFEGYVKIAGPVVISVLEIVAEAKGIPVPPALQAKINADQTALNTLAQSVAAASQQNLPTTCSAFNTAVSAFAGDLSAIETLGNVGTNTAGEIGAAVSIAQATIQEIEGPIASCQNAPNAAAARARLQVAALTVKSPNDVLRRFNAVVDKKHQVHLHNRFVRLLTFGELQ